MEKNRDEFSEIRTPFEPITETDLPKDSPPTAEELLHKHLPKPLPEFTSSTEFHRGSRSGGVGHALVAWSFMAALIDSLVLFAVACLFLFTFSLLVKVQVISTVGVIAADFIQIGVAAAVVCVWTYMIMLRIFLGFTLGEWACGLRLGSLKQRLNRFYSLRVLARMFLIFATGLFVLPIFSMILGRDLPGLIVRLPLVSLEKKK